LVGRKLVIDIEFSKFLSGGFRIKALSGTALTREEQMQIGLVILSDEMLVRHLISLGWDTLEVHDSVGKRHYLFFKRIVFMILSFLTKIPQYLPHDNAPPIFENFLKRLYDLLKVKCHPDRFIEPTQKEIATGIYQNITLYDSLFSY